MQKGALIMILEHDIYETCGVWFKVRCICDYCGVEFLRSKRNIKVGRTIIDKESCNDKDCVKNKRKESQLKKYGVENAGGIETSKEKAKKTWLNNLGVENPMFLEQTRNKIKNTCLDKYGETTFLKTEDCREYLKKYQKDHAVEINEKIKTTCQLKYGSDYPRQNKNVMDKFTQMFFVKHGVNFPSQMIDHQEKRKHTCVETYGFDHPVKSQEIQQKIRDTCIEKYGRYPVNCFGKTENDIKQFITHLGLKCYSDRTFLNGKEIDIYIPDKNLAIEYCGLFWHNEMSPCPRDKKYHFEKYKLLEKQNIRLITIFEDEWIQKEAICRSAILAILGVFSQRIPARKCSLEKIDISKAKEFLDENHLQGGVRNGIACGLFFENKLVAVVTYGKHHRQNQIGVVITRFCTLKNTQIIGGISKLFSHIKKDLNNENIISWSDNRWSEGNIYKNLGFELMQELPPDYSYYKFGSLAKRRSKQSMKKSNTGCPKEITERDWCIDNGYVRIWDCGKKRWEYKN